MLGREMRASAAQLKEDPAILGRCLLVHMTSHVARVEGVGGLTAQPVGRDGHRSRESGDSSAHGEKRRTGRLRVPVHQAGSHKRDRASEI